MALSTQRDSAFLPSPHQSAPQSNHDVFLSFRGEDTRLSFVSHLYHELQLRGIETFKDDPKLERGTHISSELFYAIEESRLAIVVLSPNYASSSWCLDELTKILQCMKSKSTVLPVFYHVDPSDVRKQTGSFACAFAEHEERFREDRERVKSWRDALTEVANLSGFDSKNECERKLIEKIVEWVWSKMHRTFKLLDSTELVGIKFTLEQIDLLLAPTDDVRFIGIWGMGGIGKTTIAKLVYESISINFEVSCFLANVREVSAHGNLVNLQKQLLFPILKEQITQVWDEQWGTHFIKNCLSNKKVLLILDDVSESSQLEKLAGEKDWFGKGSIIIITTRDERLLVKHDMQVSYKVEGLSDDDALELFSRNAFRKNEPDEGFMELSKGFVNYARGLPLALKLLGCLMYKRDEDEWESELDKLRKIPKSEIIDLFKISYDGLDEMNKDIFLDVAFFHKGKNKQHVIEILDSCGLCGCVGINALVQRSLLIFDISYNCVEMHDLIQEMALEIVRRECPEEPGRRSRLCNDKCAVKFPEVASTVVHPLMDFLGDTNVASALDVAVFVREIIETNPKLRVSIITRLLDTFYQIRNSRVCTHSLWIIGEYCLSLSEVESGIATIKQCLGELPFYTASEEKEAQDATKNSQVVSSTTVSSRRPVILADGTYATQSAALETAMSAPVLVQGSLASVGNLRSLILSGDFFLETVVACTLTKLVLRLEEIQPSKAEVNKATTQALLIMVSMLQLGQSPVLPHPIDNDSRDRIVLCIRLLCHKGEEVRKIWLESCRQSFVKMLADKQLLETEETKAKAQILSAQPDDLIDFYHLKSRKGLSQLELEDAVQDDLKRATGEFTKDRDDANKLNRILQLTGFSDPVYAEAYVTVNHYDIVLDVTVINRTKETLQNLCLELATMGDLKLVERPQNYTLAPESSKQIKANIKVSSTETGVIFGNIVYETSSNVLERTVIVLNDIHIDIMDYISPASCADVSFRTMWAEFEWENKVAVNTVIQDEKEFLNHVVKATNMKCLTTPLALEGECGVLAANLYAKSVFGEDALVNVSVEKQADGKLSGYIRIRSKTQGIALSLGDKITLKQKGGL